MTDTARSSSPRQKPSTTPSTSASNGLTQIVIDVHASHFWDITGINALDRVVLKFRHHDIPLEIVGLNEASSTLVDKLGTHNKEGAKLASGH
jgi:sulfate permease, SulP family